MQACIRWSRRLLAVVLAGALLVPTLSRPVSAQNDDPRLTQLKAVFIYHFLSYVYWPEEDSDGPFRIGILGESPLEAPLRAISEKRKAGGRALDVEVFLDRGSIAEDLHLLYLPDADMADIEAVRETRSLDHVLLVTDAPGMARDGGAAINFVIRDDRLKFEVNRRTLQESGLRAGAQLLKLAILVNDGA